MPPRILIFGTGGIGAGYAYILLQKLPVENVVTICRSNYEAASKHGFRMDSAIFGTNLTFKPTVVRSVDEAVALDKTKPFDYVLVTSKALHTTPPVTELIKPAISAGSSIVLIQNGIGIEDEYVHSFPETPLLSVVVYFAVTQTAPAVLDHSEIELLHVGTYPAAAPKAHKQIAAEFVQLITDCGATAKVHDDVQAQRWTKLIMNASINPICALSRLRDSQFLETGEGTEQFMIDTMKEIVAVAQAYGHHNVSQQNIDTCMGRIRTRRPPGVAPSMLADALSARSMEVEAIVGNVVRLARGKAVPVPILNTIYMLVRALDASFSRDRGDNDHA